MLIFVEKFEYWAVPSTGMLCCWLVTAFRGTGDYLSMSLYATSPWTSICMVFPVSFFSLKFICYPTYGAALWSSNNIAGTKETALDWSSRLKIAIGTARGLRYLHEDCRVGCIVHRDLRPKNILLTHDFEPVVSSEAIYNCVCFMDKHFSFYKNQLIKPNHMGYSRLLILGLHNYTMNGKFLKMMNI